MGFFSNIFSKIFPSANAAEVVVAAPPAPAAAGLQPPQHRHPSRWETWRPSWTPCPAPAR